MEVVRENGIKLALPSTHIIISIIILYSIYREYCVNTGKKQVWKTLIVRTRGRSVSEVYDKWKYKNFVLIKNAQPHRIVVNITIIITITVRHRENDLNDHYSLILFHTIQMLKKICVLFLFPTILYGRLQ